MRIFFCVEAIREKTGTVGPNRVMKRIGENACNRFSKDFEIVIKRIDQFEFTEHTRIQNCEKKMIEKKTGIVFAS